MHIKDKLDLNFYIEAFKEVNEAFEEEPVILYDPSEECKCRFRNLYHYYTKLTHCYVTNRIGNDHEEVKEALSGYREFAPEFDESSAVYRLYEYLLDKEKSSE